MGRALSAGLSVAQAAQVQASPLQHVLLIRVDGMHQQDLALHVQSHLNSAVAKPVASSPTHTGIHSARPSDSSSGLLALIAGGIPTSTGVYDSYNRALDALDEGIGPSKLRRDLVDPHSTLRVNSIFEVARPAGLTTAWADQYPADDLVRGPSGVSVDDLYAPEINAGATSDNESNAAAFTLMATQAMLNQLAGMTSGGVLAELGMTFQALGVSRTTKSYADAAAPTSGVGALDFVDAPRSQMQSVLAARRRPEPAAQVKRVGWTSRRVRCPARFCDLQFKLGPFNLDFAQFAGDRP